MIKSGTMYDITSKTNLFGLKKNHTIVKRL